MVVIAKPAGVRLIGRYRGPDVEPGLVLVCECGDEQRARAWLAVLGEAQPRLVHSVRWGELEL